MRKCKICGNPVSGKRKTCSEACKRALISKRVSAYLIKSRESHWIEKECPICHKIFKAKLSKDKTYCSYECARKRKYGNKETCAICGKEFFAPKSKERKTCSKECCSELVSEQTKKQDLTAMRQGQMNDPRLRSTTEHICAREWRLRSPDGQVFKFRNLNHFVRTHKEYFAGYLDERKHTPAAAVRLSRLAPWRQAKLKKRHISWNGWSWADDQQ